MAEDHLLEGGNASGLVMRVDNTVRKPWNESTEKVHGFLHILNLAGVEVPRVLGRDASIYVKPILSDSGPSYGDGM